MIVFLKISRKILVKLIYCFPPKLNIFSGFAIKFYKVPEDMVNSLRSEILTFINFPRKTNTISQKEMWRLKGSGGIKLPNVKIKSQISKAKWLIEIASNPNLNAHLLLFQNLIGTQKGNISGRDFSSTLLHAEISKNRQPVLQGGTVSLHRT